MSEDSQGKASSEENLPNAQNTSLDPSLSNSSALQSQRSANLSQVPVEDAPEAELFIRKYGEIEVSYIEPPKHNPWFTRPYALNYFYKGRLYRTRHERTSGKLELFLDLIYVGIASNLASNAVEKSTGLSFLKYFFVFIPPWTIWSDLKEIMNYYFNDDLLQNVYVVWTLALLIIYDNNCEYVDDLESNKALLTSVTAYFLSRVSAGLLVLFYSLYIKEHRKQMRVYGSFLLGFTGLWYLILLIHSNWGRCIFAALFFGFEQFVFTLSVHPWTKKKLGLEYSTALNIEHEDERFHSFLVIAIGEFLFSVVYKNPFAEGWNDKLAKGLSVLIDAYVFFSLYSNKDGSLNATHALRRSVTTAILYMYIHFPLIASLLIVGDAGADLAKMSARYLEPEERGVLLFFHVGILVALCSLTVLALLDKDRDDPRDHKVGRIGRIGLRIPIGCVILGISWADSLTVKGIMWIDCMLLVILFIYEFIVMNPLNWRSMDHPCDFTVQEQP